MKTKKNRGPAPVVTEEGLNKALDQLEKAAIPSEMRDADGGFATEGDGDELQVSAEEDAEPKGVSKARRSSEESSVVKGDDDEASDEMSDEESEPPMKMSGKSKAKKSMKKGKADESPGEEHSPAETSSPELSGDEESLGESPKPAMKAKGKAKKSLSSKSSIKKSLMADGEIRETVEASSFLETLVDAVSDSQRGLEKSVVASREDQRRFNMLLAKGMQMLGGMVSEGAERQGSLAKEVRKLRKALENLPAPARYAKPTVAKSDIVDREFPEQDGEEQMDEETYRKSVDVLMSLATSGSIQPHWVTDFEMSKSLNSLPQQIREKVISGLH